MGDDHPEDLLKTPATKDDVEYIRGYNQALRDVIERCQPYSDED